MDRMASFAGHESMASNASSRKSTWFDLGAGHDMVHDNDKDYGPDIFMASREGNVERIRDLIHKFGVDVNHTRWSGATPLHRAAEAGQLEAVCFLLGEGARVNTRASWGWYTAIHVACKNGHEEVCMELLRAGADWKVRDKDQRSPLYYAIKGGYTLMGRRLDSKAAVMEGQRNREQMRLKREARERRLEEQRLQRESELYELQCEAEEQKRREEEERRRLEECRLMYLEERWVHNHAAWVVQQRLEARAQQQAEREAKRQAKIDAIKKEKEDGIRRARERAKERRRKAEKG